MNLSHTLDIIDNGLVSSIPLLEYPCESYHLFAF